MLRAISPLTSWIPFDRIDAGLSLYPIEREQDKATKLPVLKEITTENIAY
jgi:hypothetical protein